MTTSCAKPCCDPHSRRLVPDRGSTPVGREDWVNGMVAHHRNLARVRPTVECWQTRPRPSSAGRSRSGHTAESYTNVLRLQKRIEHIHDTERPSNTTQHLNLSSRERAERLSRNKQARTHISHAAGAATHRANLTHMLRRIDDITSVAERKKNRFDTTVYPAMLLRRREEMPAAQQLEFAVAESIARAARRPSTARAHTERSSAAEISARAEAIANARLRERSAQLARRPASARRAAPPAGAPRPSSAGELGGAYEEYARRVTGAIVAERLYHEEDLTRFLKSALADARNAHLDYAELRARTEEIAAEFFCKLD